MQNSKRIRKNIASNKPVVRAFDWSFCGNLDDMIDKNTILSIPNTISRNANVSRAIHALGKRKVSKISIKYFCGKFNKEFDAFGNYFFFYKYSYILL
jgi:hypothetical protein